MEILIGLISAVLLMVFIVQIGKARELASVVRNDPNEEHEINKTQAALGVIFMVAFLVLCIGSFIYYAPYIFGWGVNIAASEHGPVIDGLFNTTLLITSIVFFLTQFALFWFAWKYRGRKNHKAIYWSHNETLEMVWMIIPAVAMTFLVVGGLSAWNEVMTDVKEGDDYMEIEATGYQFAWILRYPGRDGQLGERDFRKIDGANKLGQVWSDVKNIDDFESPTIYLPVGKKVRVRITSRDVLHNFYLPHFRVKMDAVPGMPTYFIFTPTVTTDSMRTRLSLDKEWQVKDKVDTTKWRYETFDYVLACAELCGKRHYNMRMPVKVVTQEEYDLWLNSQEKNSTYLSVVKGTKNDPFADTTALANPVVNFTKILAEKEKINEIVKTTQDAIKAARDAKNVDLQTQLSATLVNLKGLQRKATFELSLTSMQDLARQAAIAAEQTATNTPAVVTDSTAVDSTKVDSTAKDSTAKITQ
jgi:cytochrome c oxidase subunit 2